MPFPGGNNPLFLMLSNEPGAKLYWSKEYLWTYLSVFTIGRMRKMPGNQ